VGVTRRATALSLWRACMRLLEVLDAEAHKEVRINDRWVLSVKVEECHNCRAYETAHKRNNTHD
jgi:hypothetical protein